MADSGLCMKSIHRNLQNVVQKGDISALSLQQQRPCDQMCILPASKSTVRFKFQVEKPVGRSAYMKDSSHFRFQTKNMLPFSPPPPSILCVPPSLPNTCRKHCSCLH